MDEQSLPSYPTVRLALDAEPLRPGGKLTGRLWLLGGTKPVVVERVRAKLWARVYAFFDDDEGAPAVVLHNRPIAERIELAARAEITYDLSLPIVWSAPITRVNGQRLTGLSVLLMVWPEAAAPTGDASFHLEVDPLPWQQELLEAFGERGVVWDTTYAFEGSQHFVRYRAGRAPEVNLSWRVHRRWVVIELNVQEFRLTHAQARQGEWRQLLSKQLDTLLPRKRKRG